MVEYNPGVFAPFQGIHDHDMPCSVCMATGRMTKLVVPGRNTCPSSDWTLEYKGYLQSSKRNWYRTETICLDESPEVIPNSERDQNGAVLLTVEYRCNGRCGDYTDGFELTCAMCTV